MEKQRGAALSFCDVE